MPGFAKISALAVLAIGTAVGCGGRTSSPASQPSSPRSEQAPAAVTQTSAATAATMNLLERIELPRDQVRGEFRLASGTLFVPAVAGAQLELPVQPPLAYRLEMDVERTAGQGSLNIGLVVDGHPTMLVLEGWGRTLSGLSLVDGQTAESNSTTYRQPIFTPGRPVRLVCTVHPGQVQVQCNEQTVVKWQGDPSRLSLAEATTRIRTPNRLLIGGWQSEFRITRLSLNSMDGEVVAAVPDAAGAEGAAVAPLGDDWPVFKAKGRGFSARFPQTPNAQWVEGTTQFITQTSQGAYIVAVSSAADRGGLSPDEFLDHWQAETFNSGERVLRVRPLSKAGAQAAREVAVVDNENDLIVSRCFLTRDRLYQALYVGRPDRLDAVETTWFLASFELLDP